LASPGQDPGGICRLATIAMNSTASAPGFAVVIGLDRSDRKVDLCQFSGSTCEPAWATVSTSPEALRDFFLQLRASFPEGRIDLAQANHRGILRLPDWTLNLGRAAFALNG
jgi:hypothetical protein